MLLYKKKMRRRQRAAVMIQTGEYDGYKRVRTQVNQRLFGSIHVVGECQWRLRLV